MWTFFLILSRNFKEEKENRGIEELEQAHESEVVIVLLINKLNKTNGKDVIIMQAMLRTSQRNCEELESMHEETD